MDRDAVLSFMKRGLQLTHTRTICKRKGVGGRKSHGLVWASSFPCVTCRVGFFVFLTGLNPVRRNLQDVIVLGSVRSAAFQGIIKQLSVSSVYWCLVESWLRTSPLPSISDALLWSALDEISLLLKWGFIKKTDLELDHFWSRWTGS